MKILRTFDYYNELKLLAVNEEVDREGSSFTLYIKREIS